MLSHSFPALHELIAIADGLLWHDYCGFWVKIQESRHEDPLSHFPIQLQEEVITGRGSHIEVIGGLFLFLCELRESFGVAVLGSFQEKIS